MAKADTHVRRS